MARTLAMFVASLLPAIAAAAEVEPAPVNEGGALYATTAFGLVLFLLGLLFILRKLFTILLNLSVVLLGAALVLLAVYAKPLGVYDWLQRGVERWLAPQKAAPHEGGETPAGAGSPY